MPASPEHWESTLAFRVAIQGCTLLLPGLNTTCAACSDQDSVLGWSEWCSRGSVQAIASRISASADDLGGRLVAVLSLPAALFPQLRYLPVGVICRIASRVEISSERRCTCCLPR